MVIPSSVIRRKVTRQLALEFREITGNHGNVEAAQDGFLRLAIEQKPERRLDQPLRALFAPRQALASLTRDRHLVARLVAALMDDDLERKRVAALDLSDFNQACHASCLTMRRAYRRRCAYGKRSR